MKLQKELDQHVTELTVSKALNTLYYGPAMRILTVNLVRGGCWWQHERYSSSSPRRCFAPAAGDCAAFPAISTIDRRTQARMASSVVGCHPPLVLSALTPVESLGRC